MGTRSRIARANDDGTFTSIYCHWDGYPSGVGKTLLESYSDPAKLEALLALGDISSLGSEIGEQHSFEDRSHEDWTLAYGRDRGETGVNAEVSADLDALSSLTKNCGGEWLYVFKGGQWYCAEGGVSAFGMPATRAPGDLRLLSEVLAEEGLE